MKVGILVFFAAGVFEWVGWTWEASAVLVFYAVAAFIVLGRGSDEN